LSHWSLGKKNVSGASLSRGEGSSKDHACLRD
jgi:hypothetical protein